MRLDRYLSNFGVFSRSGARRIIKSGQITLNEKLCKQIDAEICENDIVKYNNEKIEYIEYIYLMLNKPSGYLSATVDRKDKTILDLIGEEFSNRKLSSIGRLDKDTEGLIILTDDGTLLHNIISPKMHVAKEYFVRAGGIFSPSYIDMFYTGIRLGDGYITMPAKLEVIQENEFYVTIYEGRFHQIKRMFASVGMNVEYLKRLSIKGIKLDEKLELGSYRKLNEHEIMMLKK